MRKEIIEDIITTALEGGINYWACLDNTTQEFKDARQIAREQKGNDLVIEDILMVLLENNKGVKFEDAEEEMDSEDWVLTMDNLMNGIELWCDMKNIRSFERWYDKDGRYEFDANDADCIFQYALFGELVFG